MAHQTRGSQTREEATHKRRAAQPVAQKPLAQAQSANPISLQRAMADPAHSTPTDVLALQRAAGNRATTRLIQAKLTAGAADDQYEQEADRLAEQVTTMTVDAAVQRTLTPGQQRQVESDTRAVEAAMGRMSWSGSFGPSVTVETPLKWENEACRQLYLGLKDTYDDQQILGTRLYYYFGAIGNWGKAGFRITGHTKPRDSLRAGKDVRTAGVLHVENS